MPDRRKPAPRSRKPPASRDEQTPPRARAPVEPELEDEQTPEPASARPVAVGAPEALGAPESLAELAEAGARSEEATRETPLFPGEAAEPRAPSTEVERPLVEAGLGVACLALAVSVLTLDWYTGGNFGPVSAWSVGPWGPIAFFLGVAGVAIVALRLARVAIEFPFAPATIYDGIGFLSLLMLVGARFLTLDRSKNGGFHTVNWFIAVASVIGILLLSGQTSSSAPLVVRPGWFRTNGGKIGAAIVAVAVVGGLAFGFVVNPPGPPKPKACAKGFPVPAGVTDFTARTQFVGNVGTPPCILNGHSTLSPASLTVRYLREFTAKKWRAQEGPRVQNPQQDSRNILLLPPVCGTIQFTRQAGQRDTLVTGVLGDCKIFGRFQPPIDKTGPGP